MRKIHRWMMPGQRKGYTNDIALFQGKLEWKHDDKNKLEYLHELHVYCMIKGKAHQRYIFGTRASIALTREAVSSSVY